MLNDGIPDPSETFLLLSSYATCHQQVSGVSLKALSIVQQLKSLLRWSMTWLTERLPLRCPSQWAQSGWIWLAAVITSIFQNELHLMTGSDILNARQCFPVQVSDDAVQQRLSNCTEAGNRKKNVFGNVAGQQCFKHLTHSWTCTASSSCYKDFHWIHPKSLCCHFNLSLTYGIVCLNACGYYTYYFTRGCPSTCRTSPIN